MAFATWKPQLFNQQEKIISLDLIRGLGLVMVVFYHIVLFISDRQILSRPAGIIDNLKNFASLPGIFAAVGYQGVHLFIVLSGFVLTLSYAKNNYHIVSFYQKRLKRILIPFYLVLVISAVLMLAADIIGTSEFRIEAFIKALFFPIYFDFKSQNLSMINRAWWFLPLIFELYLVFPFIFKLKRVFGLKLFLVSSFLFTLGYRFIAVFILKGSPIGVAALTSNGSWPFILFPARLFEFCLGIYLAFLYLEDNFLLKRLSLWHWQIIALILWIIGTIATFYPYLWFLSDPLISIGLMIFGIFAAGKIERVKIISKLLLNLAKISYPLYLIHYTVLIYFFSPLLKLENGKLIYISSLPLYLAVIIVLAKVVERGENTVTRWIKGGLIIQK